MAWAVATHEAAARCSHCPGVGALPEEGVDEVRIALGDRLAQQLALALAGRFIAREAPASEHGDDPAHCQLVQLEGANDSAFALQLHSVSTAASVSCSPPCLRGAAGALTASLATVRVSTRGVLKAR